MPRHRQRFRVSLLPAAFADLDEIFDYILAKNPTAAGKTLQSVMLSLDRLKNHPHSGSPLLEHSLRKFDFRMIIVSPYIAFYRVLNDEVLVYRVLHGARDYARLLQKTTTESASLAQE